MSSEGGQVAHPGFSVYHATKWGIEGFIESVAQEVAPFGIEFTIVEPGPTRTNFGASKVSPPPLPVYARTPAGEIRRALENGTFAAKGDAARITQVMADSVERRPAPRRLTLGTDAYGRVHATLTGRLAALEQQKQIAFSTDLDH